MDKIFAPFPDGREQLHPPQAVQPLLSRHPAGTKKDSRSSKSCQIKTVIDFIFVLTGSYVSATGEGMPVGWGERKQSPSDFSQIRQKQFLSIDRTPGSDRWKSRMAEREGFEPSVEVSPYTRLAGEHLQPTRSSLRNVLNGGGRGIRTPVPRKESGFQDRRLKPLGHPSMII
jgi:hypothetical protein